jgi:phenylacetate-CoA ligase
MFELQPIYDALPPTVQNIICSAAGWNTERTRFNRRFDEILAAAEDRPSWPRDAIEEFRDERLRTHIKHAVATVPYYGALFRHLSLDPEEIRSLSDLQALPILTKPDVQDRLDEFSSTSIPSEGRIEVHTSGTTGGGLRFCTVRRAIQEQWAIYWRRWRWHGIERGTWCGYFSGRSIVPMGRNKPPFWRYNKPRRQILFSAYHASPANLPAYIGELRSRRPPWLHGYPSLITLLAAHLLETGRDLGYQIRWITTGAETLTPVQTKVIRAAFGVTPTQHYGLTEAVANFSECDRGSLHVDEDFAAVEFIADPGAGAYRVIGTNFTNPATPLLRYDTQDLVSLEFADCSCGRAGRLVRAVDGRREDYVLLTNGARLGRMDHAFKDMVNVREAQIYQARVGEITLRVVRGPNFGDDDEARLLRETRQRVGKETRVQIDYVSGLERSPNGKLRFVVSDLSDVARTRVK